MSLFKYQVEILELKEIHEMPGAWSNEDFLNLLKFIEYDDADSIPREELKEMACLALSDFEAEEAAIKVLEFRLGDRLNSGQRLNLSEELKDDRLWEEYSDLKLHEELFNIGCILYWTFPKQFSTPDIVKLKMRIKSLNKESQSNLLTVTPSFLTRILNDGMDEHNIINRLFEANLKSDNFPEAEHIIWNFEADTFNSEDHTNTVTIYTSWHWTDDLKGVEQFESSAFSDGQLS